MDALKQGVLKKIKLLGYKDAAAYFGVSIGTVSNWATGRTEPSLSAAQLVLNEEFVEQAETPLPAQPPEMIEYTWMGRKVMILLPVYRSLHPETHFTLFANYARYGPDKIGMIMEKRTLIYESRNILIHKALKTDAEWFIFVDDDMVLPHGSAESFNVRYRANLPPDLAGLNAIQRLMSHPEDKRIVGALYFGRHAFGRAQCCSGFANDLENRKYHELAYRGLKKEEWVGTGMLKIHRSVFPEIKAAIDAGKYPMCVPMDETKWYGYFTPYRVGVGEDVSFGRRCTELGIHSYVDTSLICLHVGEVYFGPKNTKAP